MGVFGTIKEVVQVSGFVARGWEGGDFSRLFCCLGCQVPDYASVASGILSAYVVATRSATRCHSATFFVMCQLPARYHAAVEACVLVVSFGRIAWWAR